MRCIVGNQLAMYGIGQPARPRRLSRMPERSTSLNSGCFVAGGLFGGMAAPSALGRLGLTLPHLHRARLAHPGCIATKTRTGLDVGLRGYAGYSWVLLGTLQRRRTEDVQVHPDEEPCDRRGEASFSSRTHTHTHIHRHTRARAHSFTRTPPTVWRDAPRRG